MILRAPLAGMLAAVYAVSALAAYDYSDNRAPSTAPPGDLTPSQCPMFISIGWDDNSISGVTGTRYPGDGMKWILDFVEKKTNPIGSGNAATFDGTPVRMSFFSNSCYMWASPYRGDYATSVKWVHNLAYRQGHEIGNHTENHADGRTFAATKWESEIQICTDMLTKPAPADKDSNSLGEGVATEGAGIPNDSVLGFRTPFLFYNDAVFGVQKNKNFVYDCSIEEGFEEGQDGTNCFWPYTLNNGSPGHEALLAMGSTEYAGISVTAHPGLWEMPYAVTVPPDNECAQYGIASGTRAAIASRYSGFDASTGKITGLDYNMWAYNKGAMSKAEYLATLKHTLDLRMRNSGNRAPMLFGSHTQYYFKDWNGTSTVSCADRKAAVEEFITYALSTYPDVRFVPMIKVLEWCRNPVPLTTVGTAPQSAAKTVMPGIRNTFSNAIDCTVITGGEYTITIFGMDGSRLYSTTARLTQGENSVALPHLSAQTGIATLVGEGISIRQAIILP